MYIFFLVEKPTICKDRCRGDDTFPASEFIEFEHAFFFFFFLKKKKEP